MHNTANDDEDENNDDAEDDNEDDVEMPVNARGMEIWSLFPINAGIQSQYLIESLHCIDQVLKCDLKLVIDISLDWIIDQVSIYG